MAITARYIDPNLVKDRLYNKVNFIGNTSLVNPEFEESDSNVGMTDDQLNEFINQASSFVEFALSPLYIIPFQNINGGDYTTLPPTTIDFINNLITNRSCMLILQSEFSRDTGTKGTQFMEQLQEQWTEWVDNRLLLRSDEGKYLYPPLLNLAYNTNQYDLSAPISAPVKVGGGNYDALKFASRHVNNPSQKLLFPYSMIPYPQGE